MIIKPLLFTRSINKKLWADVNAIGISNWTLPTVIGQTNM